MDTSQLAKIGIPSDDNNKALSAAVRIRVDEDMLTRLDAMEADLRGQGFRHATRSAIIRAGIAHVIAEYEAIR